MSETLSKVPVYEPDLFSREALKDPFPHYRQIRDLGPLVYLSSARMYALSRFDDVKVALRSADRLVSSKGNSLNDVANGMAKDSTRPGVIISDGEMHQHLRAPLVRQMAPGAIKENRARFKEMISEQVASLKGGQTFDGVDALAKHLPLAAVSHLLGLPEEGRQNMLRWAAATFNIMGQNVEHFQEDMMTALEGFQYLEDIDRKSLVPGSWAATLFELMDEGKLTEPEARGLMGDFMIPSLDTTIFAKGNLLYNLGKNPDQWQMIKSDPSLIPSAVLESVRHSAVVRWFSRYAETDYTEGDVHLPKGERVAIMYGSANRDERHYPDPDSFKADRNPRDQLGWGHGPHVCAGMHLARLEMEVLLEALVEQVETIEVFDATTGANQGLFGFESVSMALN
ncbi:cytochrome P450 [Henriciella marina]|uniref:Cytochrome P450 n=1 Tax=Henriciella marina TaxID=453851 RepID=A0ABT4LQQ2_9PROT|nr:cytochrome P450 [Henriciella marina]MCZ4296447.1 cytochrome P450 [Henriciella marina]